MVTYEATDTEEDGSVRVAKDLEGERDDVSEERDATWLLTTDIRREAYSGKKDTDNWKTCRL